MSRLLSTPSRFRRIVSWWPPYRFAGIRVTHISEDWSRVRVKLKLGRFNRNLFGTQFGGSLYSMTDPFWVLVVLKRLGQGYVVWDKAAEIDYVAPGRGDVYCEFHLTEERAEEIRAATADGSKALPWFETLVTTEDGTVVARVRKQLYVRPKRREPETATTAQPSQPGRTSPDS
ncbi:DUF4442 domain-containing protein [Streptomyces sp. NPDC005438]|uniref:DUF4442 domain-containing protein n=1 Tax=Streptomyces sp. NPDC005438 TaxID=3156880 RepID=UPI00339E124A